MRGAGTASDENETGESKPSRITLTRNKMKTKHTKGAWTFGEDGHSLGTTIVLSETAGYKQSPFVICRMAHGISDEATANARLIAAAPQMLETIGECLDTYANKEQNGTPLAIYEKCLMLLLNDTYKKATGEKYEPKLPKSTI